MNSGPAVFATAPEPTREATIARAGAANGNSAALRQDTASDILEQAGGMIDRLGELAVRGSDGSLSGSDRQALQVEADDLVAGLQDLFSGASYGGQPVLQGDTHVTHVDGALSVTDADGGNVTAHLGGLDLSSQASSSAAVDQVKNASSSLTVEKVKAANNGAAMTRSADVAALKAANIEGAAAGDSGSQVLQAVQELALTRVEQARMAATHTKMRAIQSAAVDRLM